jgi:signal transduction histidine kinase
MADDKPNVLLVDDVEANLVTLDALLCDMNCHLVRAHSGNEALRELLKRDFAVMLLDVQMPGMDGYEVAKYARENRVTQHVPIIFLTAMHENEESLLRGYGSGAVDFLRKPITAHVLRAKVRVFIELYLGKQRLTQEIAAHKQTLVALEQANLALRHFTNAASHDLRAPLRAMRGFLEALSDEASDGLDGKAKDYLTRSQKAGQRMDSLLNALLIYAGLQRPVSYTDVDCDLLLEQVRTDLTQRIDAAHAILVADKLPTVVGDADRLYQLLLNLVGNALKFRRLAQGHCVKVSVDRRPAEAIFRVEDNGVGIDANDQKMIFEAFQRVYAASEYEGSGLGLTICRQIVEQHGGRLWVESTPGSGSSFYFALPQVAPAARRPGL